MSTYEILLFLHIIGALLIAAGAGIGTACGIAMSRTNRTRSIEVLSMVANRSERFSIMPGAVMTFVFGTWLVTEVPSYEFSQGWISGAYVLWVLAMALGGAVLGRHVRAIEARAAELVAQGVEESDELHALASKPIGAVAGNVLVLLLLGLLYLMVMKPGL